MSGKDHTYCCVPQCSSGKKTTPSLTFHLFPEAGKYRVTLENKSGNSELVDARKAWIQKLRIGKPVSQFMKVCSQHFRDADYIPRDATFQIKRKVSKKTAVPSLKLPVIAKGNSEDSVPSTSNSSIRSQRLAKRNQIKEYPNQCECENENKQEFLNEDDLFEDKLATHSEQDIEVANMLLNLAKSSQAVKHSSPPTVKHVAIGVQVNMPNIETISGLFKSDKDLCSFTGINFKILNVLLKAVQSVHKDQMSHKLPIKERIILVFVKLRLNLTYVALGTLFGISEILTKIYICELIPILAKILRCAITFPDSDEIKNNMPKCFKGFEVVRLVLDCTEIKTQQAKCLCCRIRFYSQYKSSHTVNFMTGVSPGGLITFVSKPFGGRASDKAIFEKSKLIEKLKSGKDKIMTDKGFLIDDICFKHNVGILRSPFLRKEKQFTEEESQLNRKIPAARVHIERSNQRLKIFNILDNKLTWNMVLHIHDIFTIICGVTNLSSPILANIRF